VLLATHNTEEALELCDRVGVLNRGRLLAEGTAESLARRSGDPRYRLVPRTPIAGALDRVLGDAGATRLERSEPDPDGWVTLTVAVPGGNDEVSRLIERLGSAGVTGRRVRARPEHARRSDRDDRRGGGGDGGAL
jgi:ABC-2 type transport system ATP-binding protein